jgi:hypothetical protein
LHLYVSFGRRRLSCCLLSVLFAMLLFERNTQLLVVVLVSVPLPTAKDSLSCQLLIVASGTNAPRHLQGAAGHYLGARLSPTACLPEGEGYIMSLPRLHITCPYATCRPRKLLGLASRAKLTVGVAALFASNCDGCAYTYLR